MQTALIKKYNQPETLIVFSSYAANSRSLKTQNALAWYTKELLQGFPKDKKIIVLAEKTKTDPAYPYEEKSHLLIIPCWGKNDLLSLINLFSWLRKFNKPKNILFEFEFNIFGHIIGPIFALTLLIYLRLIGKRISLHIHEVVKDLTSLKKQLNISNKYLILLLNTALKVFYYLSSLTAENIIVNEISLAQRLEGIINKDKIRVFPIPVDQKKGMSKKQARKILKKRLKNKFIILLFGYISWYKGIDWLIKHLPPLRKQNQEITLVIAGGKSPTLRHKPHYQNFYNNLRKRMRKTKGVIHTGFITDKQAKIWFSASDLVILPYRVFKSSSGPLSWALALKKPIIFSSKLLPYAQSKDFQQAMEQSGLSQKDLFFDLEIKSLTRLLKNLKIRKLKQFSSVLGAKRSRKKISRQIHALLSKKDYPSYSTRLQAGYQRISSSIHKFIFNYES